MQEIPTVNRPNDFIRIFDFKKLIEEISEETLLTSILLIGNLTIDYF